jgi:hypothetical protein
MLERPSLWFSPPTSAWPPGLPVTAPLFRRVLSADTRELLGHVAVKPKHRWWRPANTEITVYEGPDSSHLFRAVSLGWLRRTLVVTDADGNAVAYLYDDRVVAPQGRLAAFVRGNRANGAFIAAAGNTLAAWTAADAGIRFEFLERLTDEPFTKMGMLAAVLMLS